jgi:hypothetical protein
VRILADTRFARPDGPERLAEALLSAVPGGRAMRRAMPSRPLFSPRLPAIGVMCVSVRLLAATRARRPRREAIRLLFMRRQQIGLEGGELEHLLGVRIGRRRCSHRGWDRAFVLRLTLFVKPWELRRCDAIGIGSLRWPDSGSLPAGHSVAHVGGRALAAVFVASGKGGWLAQRLCGCW